MTRELALIGLIGCLALAILGFGGMELIPFAVAQICTFLLFGIVIWSNRGGHSSNALPWKGPALLMGYGVLQAIIVGSEVYSAGVQLAEVFTYVCLFCITVYATRRERARNWLVVSLISLGLFEVFYGLVQYFAGWQYIYAYKKRFYTDHATGTYVNPNHFAGLLEMILPLAFALTLYQLERISPYKKKRGRRGVWNTRSGDERAAPVILYLFSSLLLFSGVLLSRSRMGIFSASIVVVVMVFLWINNTAWGRSTAALLLIGVLVVVATFSLWLGLDPVVERFETAEHDLQNRVVIWKDTLSLIGAHPIFGVGLGSFADSYRKYQTTMLAGNVIHAHNDYLEITAEWGILGTGLVVGLFLVVLARVIRAFYRATRARIAFLGLGCFGSILAILLHSLMDFNLHIHANAMVFAVVLGLGYSITRKELARSEPPD